MSGARQRLRVAAAQYPIEAPADLAAWRDKQARWVGDGAATGADMLVLPEYALMELAAACGARIAADLNASLEAVADAEADVEAHFAELARSHRVHLLAPSGPVRQGALFRNAARLHAPGGTSARVEKRIMTPFERDWGLSGGAGPLRVLETALGRIGVCICYDSEFPLLARAMAEAGAEVLLIPSCTERISGYNRVRTAALARALENGVAAVVSPTVGEARWSPAVDVNRGAAGIYVPAERGVSDTGVLAEGALDAPAWVVADIDLAGLRRLRAGGEMHNCADWPLQPGAVPLAGHVEVVRL